MSPNTSRWQTCLKSTYTGTALHYNMSRPSVFFCFFCGFGMICKTNNNINTVNIFWKKLILLKCEWVYFCPKNVQIESLNDHFDSWGPFAMGKKVSGFFCLFQTLSCWVRIVELIALRNVFWKMKYIQGMYFVHILSKMKITHLPNIWLLGSVWSYSFPQS